MVQIALGFKAQTDTIPNLIDTWYSIKGPDTLPIRVGMLEFEGLIPDA